MVIQMIVSIHQPDYIPWLGYFNKISKSDIFVFLDDAQYSTDNLHNWNRIKTPQGELKLKVPVVNKLGYKINEVRTRDELGWKQKHLKTIAMNYKKAEYFDEVYTDLEDIILRDYQNIADMNIAFSEHCCKKFGFKTKFLKSSDMEINTAREEKVIDIVEAVGGDEYYSGMGAAVYQDPRHFEDRGIKLTYIDFKPFLYKQLWDKAGFVPALSVVDYVMNCGYNWYE